MFIASRGETLAELPRTPEAFYNTNDWGAKSGQTLEQLGLQWQLARGHHVRHEAHNFGGHALDVLYIFNQLADAYEAAHPDEPLINRKIGNAGAFWHDSDDIEVNAAALFARFAPEFGFNSEEIGIAQNAMLSTAEAVELSTREEKLLAMADLYNLGNNNYATVKQRTKEFTYEAREQAGDTFDETEFRKANLLRLANFLSKDFSLGGFELEWLGQAQETVWRMIREFADDMHQDRLDVVKELGDKTIKLFSDRLASSLKDDS